MRKPDFAAISNNFFQNGGARRRAKVEYLDFTTGDQLTKQVKIVFFVVIAFISCIRGPFLSCICKLLNMKEKIG